MLARAACLLCFTGWSVSNGRLLDYDVELQRSTGGLACAQSGHQALRASPLPAAAAPYSAAKVEHEQVESTGEGAHTHDADLPDSAYSYDPIRPSSRNLEQSGPEKAQRKEEAHGIPPAPGSQPMCFLIPKNNNRAAVGKGEFYAIY